MGSRVAVRAQHDQVAETVVLSLTPRNDVGLLQRNRFAATRTAVASLEEQVQLRLCWDGRTVAHRHFASSLDCDFNRNPALRIENVPRQPDVRLGKHPLAVVPFIDLGDGVINIRRLFA